MNYGFVIAYLIFWAIVLIMSFIVNLGYKQFIRARAKVARWILVNIYKEDLK